MSDNDFPADDTLPADDTTPAAPEPANVPDLGHLSAAPGPSDQEQRLNALAAKLDQLPAIEVLMEQIKVLENERAARARADAANAAAGYVHPPTHVLLLSNGETVETANPSATHHSTEDGVWPVIARHELQPQA